MHCEEAIQATALEVLRERGLRVPDDVSVVSVASTFDSAALPVPVDAVPLVPERSCDRAVELVMAQLAGPVEPRLELLEPTYVDRGSVRPPP